MGKNIKRLGQLILLLLTLSMMQIMPLGTAFSQGLSADSIWTGNTEMDIMAGSFNSTSEMNLANFIKYPNKAEPDIPLEDATSGFDISELDRSYFTENLGQWNDHIRFLAQTSFGYVALCEDCVFYYVIQEDKGHVIKIIFQDAEWASPIGIKDAGIHKNFFYGNDPTKWATQARSYEEVLYKDVWPDIDILYYLKNGNLKYDIIIGEHSIPDFVSFGIEGHREINVQRNGLEILISEGTLIRDTDLVAFYQDGSTVPIQFKKIHDNTYSFDVKKEDGRILIIDPYVFSTSTFLGGTGWEDARDVAIDGSNNIIILGETNSNDFPNTTGAYQNYYGGVTDIVVSKLNENTSDLMFSTYIGNWGSDIPKGLEVDDNGDIYITGTTWSSFFPTTNGAFQESDPSGSYPDVIVLKLSAQGNDLLYSTYVGGTGSDGAYDIKVRLGEAYVVGNTLSYDFPSVGPPVGDPHGTVLFFIMNKNGSKLVHSAFWGGWSNEFGYSIDLDKNGEVVVGGVTFSSDFPTTPGAYQRTVNDTGNGFILKYRPSSNSIIFSTYIGGDAADNVYALCLDESSNIYLTGTTSQPSQGASAYPTTKDAFDRTINGSKDAFITKMDPNGTFLIYSTFIGGDGDEGVGRMDVDDDGNLFLTGSIDSDVNFTVTSDCFDGTYNGEGDAFVLILNQFGSSLIYSSFLGGNASDSGSACLVLNSTDFIILGFSASSNFPVTNGSYQTENKGGNDIFLTRFRFGNFTFLYEGWNLISIPLIQQDTDIITVLSSLNGDYDTVQWYNTSDSSDPWKQYDTVKPPHLIDLGSIDHTMGFWIHITEPGGVQFENPGTQPAQNQLISLHPGWNLVGYPSLRRNCKRQALGNLVYGADIESIWTYNANMQNWEELDEWSDFFEPGKGYWIYAVNECIWEVPL